MSTFTISNLTPNLIHSLDAESALDLFARQFFQLIPVGQLHWPGATVLRPVDNQRWLYQNLFAASSQAIYTLETAKGRYPALGPPIGYQIKVLKELIDRTLAAFTEPNNDEVCDDLVNALSRLLNKESTSVMGFPSDTQESYVTYHYFIDNEWQPITVKEQRNVISSIGTTGLRTWEAALHLGAFLASQKEDGESLSPADKYITNKHVLELGAGTGVLSILCSKFFKSKIMSSTDGSLAVVQHIASNCQLNEIDAEPSESASWKGLKPFQAIELWWGDDLVGTPLEPLLYGDSPVETIIAADILYDDTVVPDLLKTLSQFFNAQPAIQVLLAATVRNRALLNKFIQACESHKLQVQPISFSASRPEGQQTGPFYATLVDLVILNICRISPSERETEEEGNSRVPTTMNPWVGG